MDNLDFSKNLIRIENSKGAKDRYTLLPETLTSELKEFTNGKNRGDPVFESVRGGTLTSIVYGGESWTTLELSSKYIIQNSMYLQRMFCKEV